MMANASYTFISIEGNIGSGKSTLLANLREHYKDNDNVIFLKEPVDEWAKIKDINGTTILEKFYADQEKYSFSFQMMAYVSRIKVLRDTLNDKKETQKKNQFDKDNNEKRNYMIITERSLYTDKMVFAKMLYDSGKIEDVNYQIYLNWFDTFSGEFPVHKVIYVKANPEKCYQRIAKRSREGEEKIPLEYLTSCSLYHDNMLDKNAPNICVCNEQLILDGNIDIYENKTQVNKWIQEIEQFIL
jgi:deoxyadenosine/deoxycytidine kinase